MTQRERIEHLTKYYKDLPDNLSVVVSLYLRNTTISTLPDNLSISGYLYLRNTPNLKSTKNVIISDYMGSRGDRTVYFKNRDLIRCGCFSGTLEEFTNRVHDNYEEGNIHRIEYDLFINECKGEER